MRKKRPLSSVYPVILVCEEKHGSTVYLAEDETELKLCYSKVFDSRNTGPYKWYYIEEPQFPEEPDSMTIPECLTDRQRALLEAQVAKDVKTYARKRRAWEANMEHFKLYKAACDGDLDARVEWVKLRCDHEYEQVNIVIPVNRRQL